MRGRHTVLFRRSNGINAPIFILYSQLPEIALQINSTQYLTNIPSSLLTQQHSRTQSRGHLAMFNNTKNAIKTLLHKYSESVVRSEYEEQAFSRFNERPVEYAFVFRMFSKLYPQSVLDVGTGKSALPALMRTCGSIVTAIDNIEDYWPSGMRNRHYHVLHNDITKPTISEKFDVITCISVLEHISDHPVAMQNMFSLLKPSGHLLLTCPYSKQNYIENVYALPNSSYGQDAPYICQSYSSTELSRWLDENNGEMIEQEYWQFWDGDYWTVGNQVIPPRKTTAEDIHQISCMLIRKIS